MRQEKTAVNQLNLEIYKGELFSLLGVNGAGKTTTIKMLSCLISPTSGDAVLLGDSVVSNPFAVKGKINIILTTHYLEEAAELSDRIAIMSNGELKAAGTVAELIEKAGETNFEDSFVKLASNGGL